MNVILRFYSTGGRVTISRFVVDALLVSVTIFAVCHIDWLWGLTANVIAGAIGGAALGKLLVDAIRRLRDAGIRLKNAAWLALVAGCLTIVALLAFMASNAPWADTLLTALEYGVPVVCGVALLWPTRQRHVEGQYEDNRTGLAIAALFVIAGALSMGFVAWLSIGMDANSRRNMAIEVSAWDGQVTKIPNGKFYPSQVFWPKELSS